MQATSKINSKKGGFPLVVPPPSPIHVSMCFSLEQTRSRAEWPPAVQLPAPSCPCGGSR